ELEKAKEEFETYKADLEPSLKRLSEIKNENATLLLKIENERNLYQSQVSAHERDKINAQENQSMNEAHVKNEQIKLQNEYARLKKFEQDLNDYDLTLKVKEQELSKIRERYELKQRLEDKPKDTPKAK